MARDLTQPVLQRDAVLDIERGGLRATVAIRDSVGLDGRPSRRSESLPRPVGRGLGLGAPRAEFVHTSANKSSESSSSCAAYQPTGLGSPTRRRGVTPTLKSRWSSSACQTWMATGMASRAHREGRTQWRFLSSSLVWTPLTACALPCRAHTHAHGACHVPHTHAPPTTSALPSRSRAQSARRQHPSCSGLCDRPRWPSCSPQA